jgi:hypothetical protein
MTGEPTDSTPYLYDAFISYRHVERDRKWAEWLIAALEGFRTPAALQARGAPRRLRKIFRDEDEVPASGDLNDQIRQALAASRFLIVVCSPYTPRSIWVQREIETFNEMGRGDNVLALLTEGEPGDSFPGAMLERLRTATGADGSTRTVKEAKEPLAADVRPRKGVAAQHIKHMALLRLVAVILGVKYDDLYQRERQRNRARWYAWGGIAAALTLVAAAVGYFQWDQSRPKVAYFRDIITRWEIPEGSNPVDEATRAHLAASYRFLTDHGKVVEVRRVNFDGALVPEARNGLFTQGSRWEGSYRTDGSLERAEFYSVEDRLLVVETYERDPATGHFIVNLRNGAAPVTLDAILKNQGLVDRGGEHTGNTEVTREEVVYDATGLPRQIEYQDYFGAPRQNASGGYGAAYVFSSTGRPTRIVNLGADGSEITLRTGERASAFDYDDRGRLFRSRNLDAKGEPIENVDGLATIAFEFDAYGNVIVERAFRADGAPAEKKGLCAVRRYGYDDRSRVASSACEGADGKRAVLSGSFASLTQRYLPDGFEAAYRGVDGAPALGPDGCETVSRTLDSHRRLVRQMCRNASGEPAIGNIGAAETRWVYDERGRQLERSYFDVKGTPALAGDGLCARETYKYDTRGNATEVRCYGEDGRLAVSFYGMAVERWAYDPLGNLTEDSFFGVDERPQLSATCGCASIRGVWDRSGALVEASYLDATGKLGFNSSAFAEVKNSYDERGNLVDIQFLDPDGRLTTSSNGYAKLTAAYDARGRRVRESYFGPDDKPTLVDGVAIETSAYDAAGNLIQSENFGLEGKPTVNKLGVHRFTAEYDSRGLDIHGAYFDASDRPAVAAFGGSSFARKYDGRGLLIEQTYFDIDGKPVLIDGVAMIRWEYDSRAERTKERYFDQGGAPTREKNGCVAIASEYDARGDEIVSTCLGFDDEPTTNIHGYAIHRQLRDSRGEVSEESYFSADGRLTDGGGYARMTVAYDIRGKERERSYFGADGAPFTFNGVGRQLSTYDGLGRLVDQSYFGADGRPALLPDHQARQAWVYDERGRIVETTYFGADGNPTLNRLGVATAKTSYDDYGKPREVTDFGVDGQLKNSVEGVARTVSVFDAKGQEIERAFYDENGAPTIGTVGVAKWRRVYDFGGRVTEQSYFGVEGRLVTSAEGYARITNAYDEKGRVIETAAFGPDGKPAAFTLLGAVRADAVYDEWGQLLEFHWFDPQGGEMFFETVIRSIIPGGMGQRLGLEAGDRFLTYGGRKIMAMKQLTDLVVDPWLPSPRVVTIRRGAQILTFEVPLGRFGTQAENMRVDVPQPN